MLLAGTLREYPFPLLLEIFLHRGETGLLEVSSSKESGYFYIRNGKVKDGQIGKNKGLTALKVVRELQDGSFRFKPLEPADYARVVWQRSFGPTIVNAEHGRYAAVVADKLRELKVVVGKLAAQLATNARRVLNKARPNTSRFNWRRERGYSLGYDFYVPSLTIPSRAAFGTALRQGVDHNIIFAITVTLLLGLGGFCVYQLVYGDQHSPDTSITIDQNFDISPHAPPTKARTKQSGNKRHSTGRLKDKKPDAVP
jgi:hypothetical protein